MFCNSGLSYYELVWYLPLKLSVTEDGPKAETGLTIKILLWQWHIIYPTSHYIKSVVRKYRHILTEITDL